MQLISSLKMKNIENTAVVLYFSCLMVLQCTVVQSMVNGGSFAGMETKLTLKKMLSTSFPIRKHNILLENLNSSSLMHAGTLILILPLGINSSTYYRFHVSSFF